MSTRTLWRLAGVAALIGGVLDLTGPLFYLYLGEPTRQAVYVLIDLLLVLGMIGLQSAAGRATGWLGLVGFVVGLGGALLVRSSSTHLMGPSSAMIAAGVWAVGMAIMGLAQLRPSTPFRLASYAWLYAVLVPLTALMFKDFRHSTQASAHAAFAIGFIIAGVQLIRLPQPVSGDPA